MRTLDIIWSRKKESEGGYLLEKYDTQMVVDDDFCSLFGTVCKVEKDDRTATDRGWIVTNSQKGLYEFDIYGKTYPGISSGIEDTLEEAQRKVEESIKSELESIEKFGKRNWSPISYGNEGIYMAQKFAKRCEAILDFSPRMKILLAGPENPQYQEAWEIELKEFTHTHLGITYKLYIQEDILWLVPIGDFEKFSL